MSASPALASSASPGGRGRSDQPDQPCHEISRREQHGEDEARKGEAFIAAHSSSPMVSQPGTVSEQNGANMVHHSPRVLASFRPILHHPAICPIDERPEIKEKRAVAAVAQW